MTAKQAARDARNTMIQLEKVKAERDRLKAAIVEHHNQVVNRENWGADDELWSVLRLPGRPETRPA
jgi:hypothetical protein